MGIGLERGAGIFLHYAGGVAAICVGAAALMARWASTHHYQDMGESSLGGDWVMRLNALTNDVVICSNNFGCSRPVRDTRPAATGRISAAPPRFESNR